MLLDEGVVADRQDGEHTVYGYDGVAAADGLATMVTVKASAVVGEEARPEKGQPETPQNSSEPRACSAGSARCPAPSPRRSHRS